MKTKKFEKKLVLNRKTIADLNNREMFTVNGGEETIPGSKVPTRPLCTCLETNCPYVAC